MKMIILAGGQKSTISEDSEGMPKPMLPIGGRPLLWHIMKHASLCGIKEFIVCGGYRIELIKDYFLDFYIYQSDIQVDTGSNTVTILNKNTEDWNVTVVDTGIKTMPVERIKKVLDITGEAFLISYGDCLSDISLEKLQEVHKAEAKSITAVVAKPSGRKGPVHFMEEEAEWKSSDKAWASAGIFMAGKEAFAGEGCKGDIEDMLSRSSTAVYRHEGFFNTIETLRDKAAAEEMWHRGIAPWMEIV
ncbi:MAG: NTP transferase domain-containing protein [Firmicutes bacterium]|nr:NTP transferase domain-containing protein [Bacillota bacterium]